MRRPIRPSVRQHLAKINIILILQTPIFGFNLRHLTALICSSRAHTAVHRSIEMGGVEDGAEGAFAGAGGAGGVYGDGCGR